MRRRTWPKREAVGALLARKFQAWETRHRAFNKTRSLSTLAPRPSSSPTTTADSAFFENPPSSLVLALSDTLILSSPTRHGPYQGQYRTFIVINPLNAVADDDLNSKLPASPLVVGICSSAL